MMALHWRGREVSRRVKNSTVDAINATMDDMVSAAQKDHPGWKSITGRAEKSIRVLDRAQEKPKVIVGQWGSEGVPYMLRLEFRHGRALIRAMDRLAKTLPDNIRRRYRFARQ